MRDQDLIERVRRGRPGAFEALYHQYVERVHRQLYAMVGDDPELEDLIQQVFCQVHDHLDRFRGASAFSTWLHRIVVNVALMHLRVRSRRWRRDAPMPPALPAPDPDRPDRAVAIRDRVRALDAILEGMKPKRRVTFVLYHVEGHTLEEIAELVEAPLSTVASRLKAARLDVSRAMKRAQLRHEKEVR